MHKVRQAGPAAPAAWRGLQTPAFSGKTVGSSIAKEFQEHPLQTLGFIAAAIAMARLAFAGKTPRDSADKPLATPRRKDA